MTKKHFIRAAALIAGCASLEKRCSMAALITILAREDNSRFDADRFAKACNVPRATLDDLGEKGKRGK